MFKTFVNLLLLLRRRSKFRDRKYNLFQQFLSNWKRNTQRRDKVSFQALANRDIPIYDVWYLYEKADGTIERLDVWEEGRAEQSYQQRNKTNKSQQ